MVTDLKYEKKLLKACKREKILIKNPKNSLKIKYKFNKGV